MSAGRALIRCDEAIVPAAVAAERWAIQKPLVSRGPERSLNLRAENLSGTVLTAVSQRAADLIRIASFIYAADQDLSRGGPADVYGRDWRRDLTLCLPVSDPDFWQQDTVRVGLADVLSFLTEDRWAFHFSRAAAEAQQIPLAVDDHAIMQAPDTVVLFSGGADSLCAAVESVARRGESPLLVSHRPSLNHDARQRRLADGLRKRFPGWSYPHLSFFVHRKGTDPADNSQRSRAFLFASLGAAVAAELGIARVLLGDNGIISLNLPFSGQAVGALASRSTHPGFLRRFNDLIAKVLPSSVEVANPLLFRTRAEVLRLLSEADCPALLQETNSCSRGRGRPNIAPHCGYCSQCVDRRFGAIAADLEEHDLAEQYGLDIFTQTLPTGEPRTTAETYVRFARELQEKSEDQYLDAYPQLFDCIDPADPTPHETAFRLISLLKNHADGVINVLATMLARHGRELASGVIPADSLLRLIVGGTPPLEAREGDEERNVFAQQGGLWTLAFRGHTVQVSHSAGLQYIVGLLRRPREEFHTTTMSSEQWVPAPVGTQRVSPRGLPEEVLDAGLHPLRIEADELQIDARTKREIQDRLKILQEGLAQAEARGDQASVADLREESDALSKYLRGAIGRGGRVRPVPGPGEKSRQSVTQAIRRSLRTIETVHPELGQHLRRSLRTGTFCSYNPDPQLSWIT